MSSGWIDVHTHLNFLKIDSEQALMNAELAGVSRCITIGTEPDDHPTVLALAEKYWPRVACTLGVHPHSAQLFTTAVGDWLKSHAGKSVVVAIGEIGLDYFYKNCDPLVQMQAFRAQMQIAEQVDLPVEIHTRDAEEDTLTVLREFSPRVRGLLHCYTGSKWLAEQALDLGFDISISGVVTFKNADALREVVRFVPVDRLHVETDAPYLTPVPLRGRPNEPAYVTHTAELVASLKGQTVAELQAITRQNAVRLFTKLAID